MNPFTLRSVMHLAGLLVAALLFVLLPFSPLVNGVIAVAFWIMDGMAAEFVFRVRASADDKQRDLRDRVDNPPS